MTPFLPATVLRGPLRVRALERVRWPRTGKRSPMTVAAIAADVAQPRDVLLNRATQRAFDQIIPVDDADDLGQLVFGEFLGPALRIDAGFPQNHAAVGPADPDRYRSG